MSLKILLAGAAALSALAATVAWAGDPPQSVEVRREVVVDGDAHGHRCHIVMMHTDGDDAMKAMGEHHGEITRDEFIAMHTRLFDQLDLNHDGKLDADEIQKAHSSMMESHDGDCEKIHMEHGMDGDMHGDMHGDDAHGDGDRQIEIRMVHGAHDFDKMDANHDGRISFEEFAAPLREAFDQLDKNHDGYIDKSEWEVHGHMVIRKEVHDDEK